MSWQTEGEGPKYMPLLNAAEDRYAIPPMLLARLSYEECHFREDIISGAVKSPAGAVGIMQLEPEYFANAGKDPVADIDTGGAYLANLHQRFKDWQLACAAYDWGPGNVDEYIKGYRQLPSETTKYVTQIFADVPVQGSILNA